MGGVAYRKPLAELLDRALTDAFPNKAKHELKIIDAGAGTGAAAIELQKLGYSDLHALDISQEMLNEAKKKNVYNEITCAALTDQQIPEINTGEFDALICCGTLVQGHVHSNAFVEMIRMVKIGMQNKVTSERTKLPLIDVLFCHLCPRTPSPSTGLTPLKDSRRSGAKKI